jgi:hypothetical protein
MRPPKKQPEATLASIGDGISKLNLYVASLEKDVLRLAVRIGHLNDEEKFWNLTWSTFDAGVIARQFGLPPDKPASLEAIMTCVRALLYHVETVERHAGAIRATLDQISNDAYSRADFKKILDEGNKKQKG